jgi:NTP pyrophosphatase (non-canonical NTP hydrolase)
VNELQECHRLVWAFRQEIEPYWATPDPLNSLRYAFCEAAEAMDAWLRAERPSDSRNNERDNDVLDELADCAIMLLTAVNPDFIHEEIQYDNYFYTATNPERHRLETLSNMISSALLAARNDEDEVSQIYYMWIHDTVYATKWIASYPGMELKQRIQGRLARIAFKHMPLFKSAELIEKLQLPANNLPYYSVNHPLVNE